jgi:hypothetical protein
MSNLPKFIAIEKVIQTLGHGTLALNLQVRAGKIVGVGTTGSKRTLYNASEKDVNTNQTALEYIVRRVSQQLENKISGELVFRVYCQSDKIKSVDVESKQTLK